MAETKELVFPKDELATDLEEAFAALTREQEPEEETLETEQGEDIEPIESEDPPAPIEDFESSEDVQAEPAESADLPSIEAPARFNEAEKEAFRTLPRQAQEAVSRIEKASRQYLTSETEKVARTRQRYEALDRVLSPYEGYLVQQRMTPDQFINGMIQTQLLLDRDPIGGLRALAARLQVDPRQLIGEQAPASGGIAPDPYLLQMQQELAGVKGLLTQQQQERQNRQYEQQYNASVAWRQERDEGGRMLRPFLEMDAVTGQAVYPDFQDRMLTELEVLISKNPNLSERDLLQQAYDNTVWVVPAARKALEEQKARQLVEQQKQRAKEARKAGKSVGNSLGSSGKQALTANGAIPSLDDEVRAFFNERGI